MAWINPRYREITGQEPPGQRQGAGSTSAPPEEAGRQLAVFPRGQNTELRLCLAEFKGHEYLSLRIWEKGRDGAWWPIKGKGCSIRLGECAELAEVLSELASQGTPARPSDARRQKRERVREQWQEGPRPEGRGRGEGFDEFGEG